MLLVKMSTEQQSPCSGAVHKRERSESLSGVHHDKTVEPYPKREWILPLTFRSMVNHENHSVQLRV